MRSPRNEASVVRQETTHTFYCFDFDGCLLNELVKAFLLSGKERIQAFKEGNPSIWSLLEKPPKFPARNYVFPFTSRLSRGIDRQNAAKKIGTISDGDMMTRGSCVEIYEALRTPFVDMIGLFSLTDCFNDLPLGNAASARKDYEGIFFDKNKIFLLYALSHYAKTLCPRGINVIKIYDDNVSILEEIFSYYTQNPELLPPKTIVELYEYDGFSELHSLPKGTISAKANSQHDPDYAKTLQAWANSQPVSPRKQAGKTCLAFPDNLGQAEVLALRPQNNSVSLSGA